MNSKLRLLLPGGLSAQPDKCFCIRSCQRVSPGLHITSHQLRDQLMGRGQNDQSQKKCQQDPMVCLCFWQKAFIKKHIPCPPESGYCLQFFRMSFQIRDSVKLGHQQNLHVPLLRIDSNCVQRRPAFSLPPELRRVTTVRRKLRRASVDAWDGP